MRCEPATSLIDRLGGLASVSQMVGKSQTTVMRWRLPKERGGTGGVVPHWHHDTLRSCAEQVGITLTPSDFIPSTTQSAVA